MHHTLIMRILLGSLAVITVLGLGACSGTLEIEDGGPSTRIDPDSVPDLVPRPEPMSRYGNPPSYRVNGKTYSTLDSASGYRERGIASWYGTKFHGRLTSSRERYDMYAISAAHTSLPLPTYARVTNLRNGRSIVVRINDRGPFHANRIIDLSYVAAAKLDILREGTGLVEVVAIDPTAPEPPPAAVAQAPDPEPPPEPPPEPQLFLQVGAFGNRFNAERLQSRIGSAVANGVRIRKLERRPHPLYRVQVGPLASVELADNLSRQLQQLGLNDMHVVIE